MKLKNETIYDSGDLRIFFKECLQRFGGNPDKIVRVAYARRGGSVGGCARMGRPGHEAYSMMIALPGPSYPVPSIHEVAHVFEHELAHNRGLMHGEMTDRVRWGRDKAGDKYHSATFPWAEGYVLRRAEPAGEYVYLCPAGHPVIQLQQLQANAARYGNHAKTSCAVPVDHPSSWRPHNEPDCPQPKCGCPFLCGERFTIKLLKTPMHLLAAAPAERAAARLDAARSARTVQAEKREARLRTRLADAEKVLATVQRRVRQLRKKCHYYDRKAARPPI